LRWTDPPSHQNVKGFIISRLILILNKPEGLIRETSKQLSKQP